jgi:hypothetical protein
MTVKERVDKHDREIAAIRKLLHSGMKMLVKLEEMQAETRKDLKELAAAQLLTEKKLQTLIDSLTRARNGHGERKLDLQ